MEHFNLETFAGGALSQQINRAIEEVAQNIQNPNTDAKAVRKITVTISFKSNDQRDFVTTGVQTNTKLAPTLGAVTAMAMGKDLRTGVVQAVEIGNQIPGQLELSQSEPSEASPEMIQTVDPSTGEIYETPVKQSHNVIDLREARQAQ